MDDNRGLWRGKRDGKMWVEGYYVKYPVPGSEPLHIIISLDGQYNRVDPSTIGGCVGFPDKNGKLIFEGDFVKHYCYKDDPTRFDIGVIFWENGHARFKRTSSNEDTYFIVYDEAYPYEVIGNIYDNPELTSAAGDAAQDMLKPAM
ncbi:MAG: hypothetical protein K1W18_07025 [Oscillospiraceae bacterium]